MKDIILENNYCEPSKLKVIGKGSSNGIDTNFFNPDVFVAGIDDKPHAKAKLRSSLKIAEKDLVYCFIGRMVMDKGLKELIRAFVEVHESRPQSKLLLVGPFENDLDPLDVYTENQVKTHPAIIWVGFKKDVRPYLFMSDVFVFPSYREGFPNVVMQSGAMGLPSIVSDINGCNEIIVNNENGIIVPPKNAEKLRDAMASLYDNDKLRTKLSVNSRSMILSRYDQHYVWSELLREYNRLTKNQDKNLILDEERFATNNYYNDSK